MATHTRSTATPSTPTTAAASAAPQRPAVPLWQAPLFVLGVVALVGVWYGRPIWPDSPMRQLERDLQTARQQLSRADGEPELAIKVASRALGALQADDPQVAEAAFLLGSAHFKAAEKADAASAVEHWNKARKHLEQGMSENLTESDILRLKFRLAKTYIALGTQIDKAITLLEEAVPKSDNLAEGYSLLTQAYLRLPTPNVPKALEANGLLRSVPVISDADLVAAMLHGGELLLRLNKTEEALKSLQNIPETAPPAVLVQARFLQAKCSQQEGKWGEAVGYYNAALTDSRVQVAAPAGAYYQLGLCYRQLGQPKDAIRAWEQCRSLAQGSDAQAANLVLGEVWLLNGNYEGAMESLTLAVSKVKSPADWKNPLFNLQQVCEVFDKAGLRFREVGRFDLAMKLLDPYSRLKDSASLLVLRGDVIAASAKAKLDQAIESSVPSPAELEARALFRQAGEVYSQVASQKKLKPSERSERLWVSAKHFLLAKEDQQAIQRLEEVAELDDSPARLGEVFYQLGELYRATNNLKKAEDRYKSSMGYDTKFAFLSRYQVAMLLLGKGDYDEAEAALAHNIRYLKWDSDDAALSQSLFTLGNLLYQRRKYKQVIEYLERAIGKATLSPEMTRARYQLADSYRQVASLMNQNFMTFEPMSPEARSHQFKRQQEYLRKAAHEFSALCANLDTPAAKEHLSPELTRQVPLISAKCWFDLGQPEKALLVYDKLIERYGEREEVLEALGGAVTCHAVMGKIEHVRQRLWQIQQLVPKMRPEVRGPWTEWLRIAVNNLRRVEEEENAARRAGVGNGFVP